MTVKDGAKMKYWNQFKTVYVEAVFIETLLYTGHGVFAKDCITN